MSNFWNNEPIKLDPNEIKKLTDTQRFAIASNLKLFIQEEFKAIDRGLTYEQERISFRK